MKNVFILIIILISCVQKKDCDDFVISKEIEKRSVNYKSGELQYGHFNIILLDNGKIFIHSKYNYECYDDIVDSEDSLLPFLRLDKLNLKEIKTQNILRYIQTNFKDSIFDKSYEDFKRTYIVIASENDTIKNVSFNIIRKQLLKQKNNYFIIRKITEEEKEVLNSIRNNLPYNSKSIQWKTNFKKAILPPNLDNTLGY